MGSCQSPTKAVGSRQEIEPAQAAQPLPKELHSAAEPSLVEEQDSSQRVLTQTSGAEYNEEETETQAPEMTAAEDEQQVSRLQMPAQVEHKGVVRPVSFDSVFRSSKKSKKERPGKSGDMRPAVFVKLQRATNKSKGELKRWFLLDTGANKTSISEADAKLLKLFAKGQETGKTNVKNAAGGAGRETVRVVLTALEGSKDMATVELTANVRQGDLGHGLLGIDFVMALGWENIDFAGGALRAERKASTSDTSKSHRARTPGPA